MGALAARRAGRWQDSIITTLALVFYATPLFWVALMSQIVFSLKLGLVPNVGYESIGANYTGLARALDIASHLVLPALTLGLFFTALYAPDDAGLDARGRRRRFRQDGPRQGAQSRRDLAAPRRPQRDPAGGDAGGACKLANSSAARC
jgi:hypothetical protein